MAFAVVLPLRKHRMSGEDAMKDMCVKDCQKRQNYYAQ